jgi:hypothetical protein
MNLSGGEGFTDVRYVATEAAAGASNAIAGGYLRENGFPVTLKTKYDLSAMAIASASLWSFLLAFRERLDLDSRDDPWLVTELA